MSNCLKPAFLDGEVLLMGRKHISFHLCPALFAVLFFLSVNFQSQAQDSRQSWPAVRAWGLPYEVNDSNTEVRFEVDSTWHLVKGAVSGIQGKVWLDHKSDPLSIRSNIRIPVGRFDTDNSSRDERLRDVMAAPQYPAVVLELAGLKGQCKPELLQPLTACACTLDARLSIRDVGKEVALPCTITREAGDRALLKGSYAFSWADFHVEDPSIFIARLKPAVTVFYQTAIPLKVEGNSP